MAREEYLLIKFEKDVSRKNSRKYVKMIKGFKEDTKRTKQFIEKKKKYTNAPTCGYTKK